MKRAVPKLKGKARDVAKGELIGLPVEVAAANDRGIVGVKGILRDETLKTFVVDVDGRMMRLSKVGATWRFTLPDAQTVEFDGAAIEFRPQDRTKKVK